MIALANRIFRRRASDRRASGGRNKRASASRIAPAVSFSCKRLNPSGLRSEKAQVALCAEYVAVEAVDPLPAG